MLNHAIELQDGRRGWATSIGQRGFARVRLVGESATTIRPVSDFRVIYADCVSLDERWS